MSNADLTQLTDQPELTVTIGGKPYQFSELPIAAISRLQTWVRANTPHPFDSLKGQLDGFPDHVAVAMGEAARKEAKSWPPQVGTAAGSIALLSTEPGQIETLYEGLAVHATATTRDDARSVYRQIQREAVRDAKAAKKAGKKYDGEGTVTRIFEVLFGVADDSEEALPKESTSTMTTPPSIGA
jgi:hypothetical protein